MSSTPAMPIEVLAVLGRDVAMDNACRLLAEEDFAVHRRDPADIPDCWRVSEPVQAVLLDESLEPAALAQALDRRWIAHSSPVFLLAKRLPDRERYMAWLEAGVWDILKVPLESVALTLRLRNMLRGRQPRGAQGGGLLRYSLDRLTAVADETLALAVRYDRPLHCLSLGLDWADAPRARSRALLDRLVEATERLTRRSDLIGIVDHRSFLVLLPDTSAAGAKVFRERLEHALEDRLREWGVLARLRAAVVSREERTAGGELLDAAARTV